MLKLLRAVGYVCLFSIMAMNNASAGIDGVVAPAPPFSGGVMTSDLDLDGNDLIVDVDGDTYIGDVGGDDTMWFVLGGGSRFTLSSTLVTVNGAVDLVFNNTEATLYNINSIMSHGLTPVLSDHGVGAGGSGFSGEVEFDDDLWSDAVLHLANGTAALPSLAFADDPDTGLYSPGTNQIGFSTAGALRAWVTSTTVTLGTSVALTMAGGTQPITSTTLVLSIGSLCTPAHGVGVGDFCSGGDALVEGFTWLDGNASAPVLFMPETTSPTPIVNSGALFATSANKLFFQDGAGTDYEVQLHEKFHAHVYSEDNTTAYTINAVTDWHVYHDTLIPHDLIGWTYDAGGGGTSYTINSALDAGGGEVEFTTSAAHGLVVGDIVSLTNMSVGAYASIYVVNTVGTTTTFEVTVTWSATSTGTMDQAATLTADTSSAGEYLIMWAASASPAGSNDTFDYRLYINATGVAGSKVRRKYDNAADFGHVSTLATAAVADGDKLVFAISNTSSSSDLTVRNFSFVANRI